MTSVLAAVGAGRNGRHRTALLLAGGLVFQAGLVQLAVALGTLTVVAVSGSETIVGLGPAIYLLAAALVVGPAGRASDSFGRVPVIRAGYVLGIVAPLLTAAGCALTLLPLVVVGLGACGAAQALVLLSRTAAAELYPPERRPRAMSLVLFGVVTGAIWGPLVFGPMFTGHELDAGDLVAPWLVAGAFPLVGLLLTLGIHTPRLERTPEARRERAAAARRASLRAVLRRPGVARALVATVGSYVVMVGVMNLSGYVTVGHGHEHADAFTVISLHIAGMYGLILVVGELVQRLGRRPAMVAGLLLMAASNASLVWLESVAGLAVAMFGLGLGWCFAYVAGSTELVDLASTVERGRLVGAADLVASLAAAALAVGGGALYGRAGGVVPLALGSAALAALAAAAVAATAAPSLAVEDALGAEAA